MYMNMTQTGPYTWPPNPELRIFDCSVRKDYTIKYDRETLPVQTICFTDLPAEIRNRIYEFALIFEEDDGLSITCPPWRRNKTRQAIQPSLTRLSRQIRNETLEMFYANDTFTVYISDFNFTPLIRFVKCITSSSKPPKVTVHVKLRGQMKCVWALLDLVRDWRAVQHQNIHLKIHYGPPELLEYEDFDQRAIVVEAIRLAKDLTRRGRANDKYFRQDYFDRVVVPLSRQLCWAAKCSDFAHDFKDRWNPRPSINENENWIADWQHSERIDE